MGGLLNSSSSSRTEPRARCLPYEWSYGNNGHKLLTRILEQRNRVRQARKGRRPFQDVDPDTGQEVQEAEVAA